MKLYRIDDLIKELDKIRKEQGHNHIAIDSEIEFVKGYTDGSRFLTEIPDTDKYRPITLIKKSKDVN